MVNLSQSSNIDERSFVKGEVYEVDFPSGRGQYVIEGLHRAVVMYDSNFPRRTVIVVPITSLFNKGNRKTTYPTDVILPSTENYLEHESFAKTEQMTCVDRKSLGSFKGIVSEDYLNELNIYAIRTLELETAVEKLVEQRLEEKKLYASSNK